MYYKLHLDIIHAPALFLPIKTDELKFQNQQQIGALDTNACQDTIPTLHTLSPTLEHENIYEIFSTHSITEEFEMKKNASFCEVDDDDDDMVQDNESS